MPSGHQEGQTSALQDPHSEASTVASLDFSLCVHFLWPQEFSNPENCVFLEVTKFDTS